MSGSWEFETELMLSNEIQPHSQGDNAWTFLCGLISLSVLLKILMIILKALIGGIYIVERDNSQLIKHTCKLLQTNVDTNFKQCNLIQRKRN